MRFGDPDACQSRENGKSFTVLLYSVSWREHSTSHRTTQGSTAVYKEAERVEMLARAFLVVSTGRKGEAG